MDEAEAVLALWCIPGLGPKSLARLLAFAEGRWSALGASPVREWLGEAPLPSPVKARLAAYATLSALAEQARERCEKQQVGIVFREDPLYPARLAEVADAPPLLFYRGDLGPPRRRVGMVGSRHPDAGFLPFARGWARQLAEGGAGVVSGAAAGVDRACHYGALDGGGETWAFLGSALDALDPAQQRLLPAFLQGGGCFLSELPPGVRASTTTFPRRNRLIAGASDAVLVLRAGEQSGSLYTAVAARQQGRPVLALPGEIRNDAAAGCNQLIRQGHAQACLRVEDVWEALGLSPGKGAVPSRQAVGWEELSAEAQLAYQLLQRIPRAFDELLSGGAWSAAALTSALVELELAGWALQLPGKLYEKV